MDQDRQIRFLIPAFLFFAWIALGLGFDPCGWESIVKNHSKDEFIAGGAAIAASLLPIGFLLAALSTLVLRVIFLPTGKPYETFLSTDSQEALARIVKLPTPMTKSQQLFAAVTFDHSIIESGVHTWIVRVWSAFNVSVNSIVAVVASHSVAPLLGISQSWSWWLVSLFVLTLLFANVTSTWRATMKMMEFQISRYDPKKSSTPTAAGATKAT